MRSKSCFLPHQEMLDLSRSYQNMSALDPVLQGYEDIIFTVVDLGKMFSPNSDFVNFVTKKSKKCSSKLVSLSLGMI